MKELQAYGKSLDKEFNVVSESHETKENQKQIFIKT